MIRGQTPARPRLSASRVPLSRAAFTDVSVAIIPATTIMGTPTTGRNLPTTSVSAVSEPATVCQGTVPMITSGTST